MVFRHISPDMKRRALQLLDAGWYDQEVADVLGVSTNSIGRWVEKYANIAKHGQVDSCSHLRGRRRLLLAQALEDIRELIHENPILFLDEIREWIALNHDQPVSTTALHNNLRDLGLTWKLLRKVAAERDDVARAAWLEDVLTHYRADQLIFLDESSKDNRHPWPL